MCTHLWGLLSIMWHWQMDDTQSCLWLREERGARWRRGWKKEREGGGRKGKQEKKEKTAKVKKKERITDSTGNGMRTTLCLLLSPAFPFRITTTLISHSIIYSQQEKNNPLLINRIKTKWNILEKRSPLTRQARKKTPKCLDRWWHQKTKNSSCFDNEMETDFVDSHNVCSRFYIQMSSSHTPRALSLCPES